MADTLISDREPISARRAARRLALLLSAFLLTGLILGLWAEITGFRTTSDEFRRILLSACLAYVVMALPTVFWERLTLAVPFLRNQSLAVWVLVAGGVVLALVPIALGLDSDNWAALLIELGVGGALVGVALALEPWLERRLDEKVEQSVDVQLEPLRHELDELRAVAQSVVELEQSNADELLRRGLTLDYEAICDLFGLAVELKTMQQHESIHHGVENGGSLALAIMHQAAETHALFQFTREGPTLRRHEWTGEEDLLATLQAMSLRLDGDWQLFNAHDAVADILSTVHERISAKLNR